jgi:hypothetical protein
MGGANLLIIEGTPAEAKSNTTYLGLGRSTRNKLNFPFLVPRTGT